ncbi:hypothetical protein [Budvicia aquatica]|uniref:Uncharacterized protein n=1 Tax=Budvicia aquatica TaxID=82979 RepID=A0A484ZAP4_9GAMM|nr:hypothetical protein [Budvicia aquatica]VFS45522.1 Uncharacterised protein [Budvicia aquatica]
MLQAKVQAIYYLHDWKHPIGELQEQYQLLQDKFPGGVHQVVDGRLLRLIGLMRYLRRFKANTYTRHTSSCIFVGCVHSPESLT